MDHLKNIYIYLSALVYLQQAGSSFLTKDLTQAPFFGRRPWRGLLKNQIKGGNAELIKANRRHVFTTGLLRAFNLVMRSGNL